MKYRIITGQDEDAVFVAEARGNHKGAIARYVASLEKHWEPVPPLIVEEVVEVSA
jgi:predicted RNase H-like HicB family nuclease